MDYILVKYFNRRILDINFRSDVAYTNLSPTVQSIIDSFMIILVNDIVDAVIFYAKYGSNVQSDPLPTLRYVMELMYTTELTKLTSKLNNINDNSIEPVLLGSLRDYASIIIPSQLNGIIIDQANLKCLTLNDPVTNEPCKSYIRAGKFVFDRPLAVTTQGDVVYKKDLIEVRRHLDCIVAKLDYLMSRRC
jgi:hypothetical protein